jgi:bifunctional non-homologous end joining protein LigD
LAQKKKLSKYKEKRDFETTPEPAGGAAEPSGDGQRYVIHEHHARSLHWDLRLERDGVLVSWAIPKGIPNDPKRNHLAVHVEDHPIEYIDFAGEIPQGEYGAGKVEIWDSGTYETHKFRKDEVMVTFHGERLKGKYVLFQTRGKNWMIHRMDAPERGREPMPQRLVPMMAKLAKLPRDDTGWAYEIKWDGVRAILYCEGGRVTLTSRNLRDITPQYLELRALGRALGSREVVLDGEIVAFDEAERPNFGLLQHRMHVGSESTVRRLMKTIPVVYMVFDVLYLDGRSTMDLPYEERRELLVALDLDGSHWRTPAHHVGDGEAMIEASREQDLEGIIAKRLDSRYEPGRRSGAWLKVKNRPSQEVVVGGWLPGQGRREDRIGSLAVGYYDLSRADAEKKGADQHLRYAGNVGTGFKEKDLQKLADLLGPLRRKSSPFEGRQPPKGTVFVEPKLVIEVEFAHWTRTYTLRAPAYKGVRDDKDPQDVVLERVEGKAAA